MTLHKHYSDKIDIYEIGVDEAGRGPLFGRVYAAAVILPKEIINGHEFDFTNMKDSKRFTSKKKIKEIAEYIKENAVAWAVSFESERKIDAINILQATQSAMHKAIGECIKMAKTKKKELQGTTDCFLLIDGNYFNDYITYDKNTEQIISVPHTCVKGGDSMYAAIAAASILAKVSRDEYIENICDENPWLDYVYKIRGNKGYGAKFHMEAIKEKGVSEWHRMSFRPCQTFSISEEDKKFCIIPKKNNNIDENKEETKKE